MKKGAKDTCVIKREGNTITATLNGLTATAVLPEGIEKHLTKVLYEAYERNKDLVDSKLEKLEREKNIY
ncbi:hypothetical protein [Clostridium sardiniense]|uniref:hypothetical protein n=1 Tax=Clostridium sardiniense TaxID=29369 RepID=UPI00195ED71D|nr:hypothetical protein [Clostridium sardiniense]MBM7835914.1 hypothetical protein [Clostridium sardiniense]